MKKTRKTHTQTRIQIVLPQFERERGAPHPAGPPEDWEALREMDAIALRELGCRPWNDPDDPDDSEGTHSRMLLLFPGEWYAYIPAGFPIVTITGRAEAFAPGRTSNDIRFGCLAYGIYARSRQ